MAEALEAMGFPSEWCERALKSSSGIETAVDLLLQWQAHGMPQTVLPSTSSSVSPASPPRSPSSGKRALQQQQHSNSRSLPGGGGGGGPTLRLLPLSSPASKAVVDERDGSPSSTLLPSTSSRCPSSLDGPSGVNHPCGSGSPWFSFPREDEPGFTGSASVGRTGPAEESPADPLVASRGNSGLDIVSRGGGRGASSVRTVDSLDSSDAVVPDAYAEERKARYTAARRAKQEKEDEKARIRQQMQEDMELRRFRRTFQSPSETEAGKSSSPADEGECARNIKTLRPVPMDTAVELQIRCPGNQIMRASFTAGATLKDVRAYVDLQLQQSHRVNASQNHHSGRRAASVPFTGRSTCLSSDRQAERELLQAARENFEVQTSRILASAKVLRDTSGLPQVSNSQSSGIIYFLIPFPRQEFFTESAMESTLAEAQLVPRGTLVVLYRPGEMEKGKGIQVQPENHGSQFVRPNSSDEDTARMNRLLTLQADMDESVRFQLIPEFRNNGLANLEKSSPHFDLAMGETVKSRRTLEMEGERVKLRERALQAAAKRMGEAAKIFRDGLPLEEGETGEVFHFPRDPKIQNIANSAVLHTKVPSTQLMVPVVASVPLPKDNQSVNVKAAGADAELGDAENHSEEDCLGYDRPDKWPLDRSLDALHRRAMAAAEGRIRNSQPQATSLEGGNKQEPEEAESRIGENEAEACSTRGRARIAQSSRLLSRPEKLQRTSNDSPVPWEVVNNAGQQLIRGSTSRRQGQISIGAASRAEPLEAALQRCKATNEGDSKGKAIVEGSVSPQVMVPSSCLQLEPERTSSLRVRLEDGNIVPHTFPASTVLRAVRDSVVPEGASTADYGFVVPFPEPHFVEGDALDATLEEVGLVPRGTIHLTKLATRGMVRQGRRMSRQRLHVEDSDSELDSMESMIRHLTERMNDRPDLTYEELMELEESIGRVHVGVPEDLVRAFPTHMVRAKKAEELDLCIVCMAEMVEGEEALSLPCVHTFHTVCIRQWLLQSTCCPTCKQTLV